MACVDIDVRERPPQIGKHRYFSFTDPSGGSADSMTCAIGHREGEIIVVDAIREIAAPFDPESAADEFSALFKSYRMTMTHGDRYAAQWVAQAFEKRGIQYRQSELAKSDLYRNLLPHLNGKTIRLLDHQRSINQIASLERRTARGGKDSIDHPAQGRDDCANALAGLTYLVVDRHRPAETIISDGFWPDGSQRWFNFNKQEHIRPAGKAPPLATYSSASAPCTIDFSKVNKPPPDPSAGFTNSTSWVNRTR
jgi:hypothetical protein